MNEQQKVEYLSRLRAELTFFVSAILDDAIRHLDDTNGVPSAGLTVPIVTHSAFFKGKKPAATVFPNGRTISTSTWKKVVQAVLDEALRDESRRQLLLSLRGRVMGRERVILDADPDNMDQPLKIGDGLYLESKYDTESLLYVLKERVLPPTGYDPIGIRITLRP